MNNGHALQLAKPKKNISTKKTMELANNQTTKTIKVRRNLKVDRLPILHFVENNHAAMRGFRHVSLFMIFLCRFLYAGPRVVFLGECLSSMSWGSMKRIRFAFGGQEGFRIELGNLLTDEFGRLVKESWKLKRFVCRCDGGKKEKGPIKPCQTLSSRVFGSYRMHQVKWLTLIYNNNSNNSNKTKNNNNIYIPFGYLT